MTKKLKGAPALLKVAIKHPVCIRIKLSVISTYTNMCLTARVKRQVLRMRLTVDTVYVLNTHERLTTRV